jgi:hypothetical protein
LRLTASGKSRWLRKEVHLILGYVNSHNQVARMFSTGLRTAGWKTNPAHAAGLAVKDGVMTPEAIRAAKAIGIEADMMVNRPGDDDLSIRICIQCTKRKVENVTKNG